MFIHFGAPPTLVFSPRFVGGRVNLRGGIDLSPKTELVYKTLRECKAQQFGVGKESLGISEITTTKPSPDESIMSLSMTATTMTDDPSFMVVQPPVSSSSRAAGNNETSPKKFPEKPRRSADVEQGCRIPEARDLEWTDSWFDDGKRPE